MKRARVVAAWTLLVGAVIGWPASRLTVARGEPPFTLGLSWLAIIMTCADFLTTAQVHRDQDDDAGTD